MLSSSVPFFDVCPCHCTRSLSLSFDLKALYLLDFQKTHRLRFSERRFRFHQPNVLEHESNFLSLWFFRLNRVTKIWVSSRHHPSFAFRVLALVPMVVRVMLALQF